MSEKTSTEKVEGQKTSVEPTISSEPKASFTEEDTKSKFRLFKCRINVEDEHFLYEPRILPCSNSACSECIAKLIEAETRVLKCKACDSDHKIERVDSLPFNESIVEQINQNWTEITDELVGKLDNQVDGLKKTFKNKNEILESQCEKAKRDVSNRINDLKSHLDVLHKELLESLNLIKDSLTGEVNDLNRLADQKTNEYDTLIQSVESIASELESDRDTAEKRMYECQDAIEDLADLENAYHKTLRKVAFEPSEWVPDEKFISAYIGNFEVDSEATDSDNCYSNDDDDENGGSSSKPSAQNN